MNILASVVIPTYKREESLFETLNSLQKQSYKDFDILVVDNAVSDSLKNRIENLIKESEITIKYIPEPRLGLHYGRNRGAIEAKTDILIYTDDDTLFPENWVEQIILSFKNPKVGAVGGKVLPKIDLNSKNKVITEWFLKNAKGYLSLLDMGESEFTLPKGNYNIYGCNMAIRRTALVEVGGFNPELYGDTNLGDGETGTLKKIQNKGWDLLYSPTVFLYHVIPPHRLTIDYLKLRAWNQGASDSYTKYHPKIPMRIVLLVDMFEFSLRMFYKYFQLSCNLLYSKDKLKLIQGISYLKSKINYLMRLFFDNKFRQLVEKTNWYQDFV